MLKTVMIKTPRYFGVNWKTNFKVFKCRPPSDNCCNPRDDYNPTAIDFREIGTCPNKEEAQMVAPMGMGSINESIRQPSIPGYLRDGKKCTIAIRKNIG
jgi:hypothetical protein